MFKKSDAIILKCQLDGVIQSSNSHPHIGATGGHSGTNNVHFSGPESSGEGFCMLYFREIDVCIFCFGKIEPWPGFFSIRVFV